MLSRSTRATGLTPAQEAGKVSFPSTRRRSRPRSSHAERTPPADPPSPAPWHSRHVFDHVTIRVSDRKASERFYETVLSTLGIEQTYDGEEHAEWSDFSLATADEQASV